MLCLSGFELYSRWVPLFPFNRGVHIYNRGNKYRDYLNIFPRPNFVSKASLLTILLKTIKGVVCARRPKTTFLNFLYIFL